MFLPKIDLRKLIAIPAMLICYCGISQQMMTLTMDDGLSQGFVSSIVQDRTGYIWAGTLNGLNRYDGYDFKTYHCEPDNKPGQLLSNTIKSLMLDGEGRLWVRHQNGVQYYNEDNDNFVAPPELNAEWLWSEEHLVFVSGKNFYLLGKDTLVVMTIRASGENLAIEQIKSAAFSPDLLGKPFCMFTEGDKLWVGTENGVCQWNGRAFKKMLPEIQSPVLDIWADEIRGYMCIQTTEGIYFTDEERVVARYPVTGTCYGVGTKGRKVGKDYYVTCGNVLWKWNGSSLAKTDFDFAKGITATCMDRQGNMWVGLDASGMVCIQNRKKKIRKVLNLGSAARKKPLIDKEGGVWLNQKIRTGKTAIADFGKYTRMYVDEQVPGGPVSSFPAFHADIDKAGRIWYVSESLALKELQSGRTYNELGGIRLFNSDYGVNCLDDGTLLLISYDASTIVFLNPETGVSIPVPELRPYLNIAWWDISSVSKSSRVSPYTWLTSPKGIVGIKPLWNSGTCEIKSFDNKLLPAGTEKNPRFIFAQADVFDGDIVWIGSWDGLYRWRLTDNSVQPVRIFQGRSEPVFCMAQTEPQILWLGAQQGLFRYSVASGQSKILTQIDGLPAREFNRNTAVVMADGMIVMGTINGTVCFYPDEMVVREKPDIAVITGVRTGINALDLKRGDTGYEIASLPYGTDNIVVQFSVLDFVNMKTPQYRFRISGREEEWILNGLKNSVTLAGLLPGRYTFEVQGSLDGSEWSESQFLYFRIEQPWWATWWAITLFALFLGVPVLMILRNRRLLIREKHNNELLKLQSEHEAVLMSTKERILTNVAHDLRTPLTLITGLAEKIGGDNESGAVKAADTIKRQSQELLGMIGQILDLGRIRELGKIPLSPRPLDLGVFIPALISSFSHLAQERSISLTYRLSANIPVVFLDESGLRAILGNLLSNSLKFTPVRGRVQIEVFAEDEMLQILVRDSGPGIPPEKVKFLFQRYYQVDGERYPGGSGIGLAYALEMTELMGGQLSWVPPALGTVTGAIFNVTFPLEQLKVDSDTTGYEAPGPVSEVVPEKSGRSEESRPLVLVVEDQQNMAEYIKSILEADYEVAIAFDGQSGLEATLELVPDLVISDIVMPGISGLDMCRAIRNDVRTSHIPIILLTAKTSEYSIRAGLESGASLYLVKPFDHEVLKKYVSNSLLLSTQTKRYFESYWGTQSRTDSSMNLPKGISSEKEDQFIRDVESLITANYSDDSFNVEKMAIALHISLSQLRRKIVALGGDSAGAMLKNYRLSRAKEMLIEMPEATISEVAFACGFSDPNYFSSAFGKDTGMTPRQFRAGKSDKTDS